MAGINTYSTAELLEVIRYQPGTTNFWLRLCFPRSHFSTTQSIDFDLIDKQRRIAPYVAPNVQGKIQYQKGYNTRKFTPAYVKPKDVVDPNRVLTRMAGESYGGNLSPEARRRLIIAELIKEQRDQIDMTCELQAAEAIIDGRVTVAGEDYPTVTVSFGRDASAASALTGSNQWGQSGVNPLATIESESTAMQLLSGYTPTDVIMGPDAWTQFYKNAEIRALLDIRKGTPGLDLNIGPGDGMPVQYRGSDGHRAYWTYADWYENNAGTKVQILDSKTLVLVNRGAVMGLRAFGCIMDPSNQYMPSQYYPKNWVENDPPVELVMTQSAPLMISRRPNATRKIKVIE